MPKQRNLFGEEEPEQKKSTHFYNKYDLLSFLIKSIRMNRKEDAITALSLLLCEGTSQWFLAKKLMQISSEDNYGAEPFIYAQSVFQAISMVKDEENSLARLVLYLCDAPKQHESEEESYWEVERQNIQKKIKNKYTKGEKPVELPEYIYDQYTATGKRRMKAGDQIQRRFSGVRAGTGLFCRAAHLVHGRLGPEDTTVGQAYSTHLEKCAKEGLHVDAYLRKHKISADEFLQIEQ